jgi:isoleucyl-tRNA synthetase
LADAEVEYRDVKSPSIYVSFKVFDGKQSLHKDDQIII